MARRFTRFPLVAVTATSILLAACGSDDADDTAGEGADAASLSVIAAFYPLEEAARGVGGDLVSVTSLTPP
eukprot:gene23847-44448_t